MTTMQKNEFRAAVAAVGQGSLNQVRIIGEAIENLDERLGTVEQSSSEPAPAPAPVQQGGSALPDLSSIQPVTAVSENATASAVRDAVRDLQGRFNALLGALKNG